ncbi:type VI secretion system needle sheath protein TssB [Syntrophotalea carbinolica DSM 2380]|uniref:Type VI secretion system needle sheath protein TssB n=1 Tax=Syntrophotalea carbinolica (strain DSM 2380 / NBRC 103641 / GraBd1) TaxID=338963 RepID=Q3A0Q8_SYNC1|nr:type VI secretion system contractile sheath small subunit [Syntrophotalea carbinolica]ABA90049.1 type VI secretion system needle sheath protein TssB [Syntrophotalea carbinolica DSM 2380]
MSDSYQKEIPKARINLALDVETGGHQKKTELPLKMLVMGDFSNGKTKGKIADRQRININKNNFESVMADLAPSVRFDVPNLLAKDGSDFSIDLAFQSMKDFRPDSVAHQIPEMHSLMAMRNLLKDLKSNLLDNAKFRKKLEKIVSNQPQLEGLKQQLEKLLDDSNETSNLEIRSY